tara:strand:- start:3194 stop:4429 length:1236 start_codon:yes stop_codon:yes gene_type:complete
MPGQNDGSEPDSAAEDAFREQVRTFLEANCSRTGDRSGSIGDDDPEGIAAAKAFQGSMADAGLAGLTFPSEFGGAGLTSRHQELFDQEAQGWYLPTTPLSISHGMCLPVLNQFGTEDQKARFMPDNISGASIWCQMFSEPGAGSDVASLSTRAVRDGDEWIIEGQKVWTSGAQYCDYGILVARTDTSLPKHQGLTMFIVDMRQPGVEVRPLRQISGGSGFNEIFFTEARVPADWQLGDLGQGWNLAVSMLMFERVSIGAGSGSGLNADRSPGLIQTAQALGYRHDPVLRQGLADLWIREQIKGYIGQRIRAAVEGGRVPGPEGSLAKLNGALLARRVRDVSLAIAGSAAQAWDADDAGGDRWAVACLSTAGISIAGGTDEVQRNIIGERVLGLPKEPDPYKGAAWEAIPRS